MLFSYRIIKGADLKDNLHMALPLRRYTAAEEPVREQNGGNGTAEAEASLQAWAMAQVEETVSRARVTADEIIRQAQTEGEQIKQQAYRDAFDKGRSEGSDEGYREGMARAEEEAAAIRAQAAEVLDQAEKIRRRTLEDLEQEIVDLARDIAERLLSAHLAIEPETVLNMAKESLHMVADRLNVVLYIDPTELELVKSKKEELQSLLPARAELQVIADSLIQPGGCRVETEQGRVDATMEARREALLKALYGED